MRLPSSVPAAFFAACAFQRWSHAVPRTCISISTEGTIPRIIVERSFDPPFTQDDFDAVSQRMGGYLDLTAYAGSPAMSLPTGGVWSVNMMPRTHRALAIYNTPLRLPKSSSQIEANISFHLCDRGLPARRPNRQTTSAGVRRRRTDGMIPAVRAWAPAVAAWGRAAAVAVNPTAALGGLRTSCADRRLGPRIARMEFTSARRSSTPAGPGSARVWGSNPTQRLPP
jgi:hypothetical protein